MQAYLNDLRFERFRIIAPLAYGNPDDKGDRVRDALLRHCKTLRPATGDAREDAPLAVDALDALEEALPVVEQGGGRGKAK